VVEKANTGSQITPDEQLELKMAEWSDALRKNARWLAVAGGVVLAVGLGGVLWTRQKAQTEAKAGAAMMQAEAQYFSGAAAQALTEFQSIADRYGSTTSGAHALLFVGNCQLSQGRAAEAEAAYRKALGRAGADEVFRSAAQRGIGASLLAQGKAGDAAKAYADAAGRSGNPMQADDWLSAGRAYAAAGDAIQAARAFQRVVDEFPDNPRAIEAKVRLEEARAAAR